MEGIMMRHKDKYSIAVRRPDKEIEVKVEDYKCIFGKARIWRKPIIRGMVSFIDSLVTGTKCLMYSAEIAGDEEDEEEECYATTCPECEEEIFFDDTMLEDGEIICPNCGAKLEFDLSDLADAADEDKDEE